MIPSNEVFDETKFDFKLSGGPTYTDVLVASATFNSGLQKGSAVALNCKWFTATKE